MASLSTQSPLYTSLHEWQTRLLCLAPGRRDEPLHASLHVVDLIHAEGVQLHGTAQNLEYEALSYTWGDPKILRPIQINGIVSNVTENLYQALLTLRTEKEQRWLWIDALCIHQIDVQEKSQHLSRMFLIFRKAFKVLVFLGDRGPNTTHAFEYLRARRVNPSLAKDMETSDGLPQVYEGLRDLWTRPWLWRIWVRQEVFAARRALVICGDDQLEWDDFTGLALSVNHLAREMQDRGYNADTEDETKVRTFEKLCYSDMGALSCILNDECPDERGSSTDIVQVLNHSVGCEMSDARDVVYGILGLTKTMIASPDPTILDERAAKDRSLSLVVDYSKDLASVFQDLGRYIFNRDQSPHILYLCQGLDPKNDRYLPSWCPDWRYETPNTISSLHDRIHRWISSYKSDGLLHPKAMLQRKSSARELVVEGVVLGEIVDQSDSNSWPNCACNIIDKDAKFPRLLYHQRDYLLRYFEAYQKNTHVHIRPGLLSELESLRHPSIEARALTYSEPTHLACHCWKGLQGHWITSDIPTVISTMFSHFWAVPKGAVQSDIVVALCGGLVPVVLRPERSGHVRYIGPAILCQGPYTDRALQHDLWELVPYLYVLISRLVDARRNSLQTFTIC